MPLGARPSNQFRRYILRFAFLQTATDCGRDRSFWVTRWVTRTRSEYGRSHAVTGGRERKQAARANRVRRTSRMRLLSRSRERRSCSVQASTKARACGHSRPGKPSQMKPASECVTRIRFIPSGARHPSDTLGETRERKEYGTVLGQQVLNLTGQIGPSECQTLRGEGGQWV
jgi:hypothetical protein